MEITCMAKFELISKMGIDKREGRVGIHESIMCFVVSVGEESGSINERN